MQSINIRVLVAIVVGVGAGGETIAALMMYCIHISEHIRYPQIVAHLVRKDKLSIEFTVTEFEQ